MILYWIYIVITAFIFIMLMMEFWKEDDWRKQIAIAMVMVVFILRILQIR
ncbi:MAG: hypothetical protein GF417_09410 [Candidatus Latescibacteria bacterium]|nr:hypothetical protein [bacterium]MBD3424641.1 hypothetical protein [Candidatus Latescibacterota bacterium]